jgi:hypothetical protein
MSTPWGVVLDGVTKLADDLITTDEERGKMALDDRRIDAGLLMGQMEVNKVEAASASFWTSGWRPYIGWVGGTALGLVYIPKALAMTGIWVYQAYVILHAWNGAGPVPVLPVYPDLGVTDLIGLVGTMLGMSGLRTKEKLSKAA